jgi:hypothetical protein
MYWCDYKWRKRLSSSAIESTAAKLLAWRESVVSEDPHRGIALRGLFMNLIGLWIKRHELITPAAARGGAAAEGRPAAGGGAGALVQLVRITIGGRNATVKSPPNTNAQGIEETRVMVPADTTPGPNPIQFTRDDGANSNALGFTAVGFRTF